MTLCTGAGPEVIHLPQKLTRVLFKGLTVFLEVILVPAAILASLGGAGQLTFAIIAVFAWRIIVGVSRMAFVGILPATSILTFLMLTAKTSAGGMLGMADSKSAIIAYILPGCIVSILVGMYFMTSARTKKPVILKLAQDFVTLDERAKLSLLPVFKAVTFIIGFLHVAFATAGTIVVLTTDERQASLLSGLLAVVGPVSILTVSLTVAYYMMRKSSLRLTFKLLPPDHAAA